MKVNSKKSAVRVVRGPSFRGNARRYNFVLEGGRRRNYGLMQVGDYSVVQRDGRVVTVDASEDRPEGQA